MNGYLFVHKTRWHTAGRRLTFTVFCPCERDKEIKSVQIALSICIAVLNVPTAVLIIHNINFYAYIYTGCPRRNGQNFGRVFLMLYYTDITQNTYIQSWTVTEIMTIEKCGLLGCPRIVRRPWRHTHTLRMPGNQTPLASIVMQWPWRDNASAAARVNYLET